MSALEKFWRDYKDIVETVKNLGGVPSSAQVVQLAEGGDGAPNLG